MNFELDINLEQKQELVMTPELQTAIELLQFSSQDLEQYVEEEIKSNPLLEKDDIERDKELEKRLDNQYSTPNYSTYVANDDGYNYEDFISYQPGLIEHLENQLYQVLKDREMKIGRYIVGNLDENGFFTLSSADVSNSLEVSEKQVKSVLARIQYLDPIGIAAHDLQESMLIQLESLLIDTTLAEKIVSKYLSEFCQEDFDKIIKEIDEKEEKIRGAINLIKTLNQEPADRFKKDGSTEYIKPDIVIKKVKEDFVIIINEKASPLLRINPHYYKMLQESKNGETRSYLQNKFKSALWLIKSIEHRRVTVYRITRAIVNKQKDFLYSGIKNLHPMTMKDIAEEIEMHESTVSRATSDKYVQTPQGLFELKFFFTGGVNNFSSVSIKAIIIEYIKNEDSNSPLSDKKIANLLAEKEGMNLSRRTVAKYRNELGIPSSVKRRS